MVSTRLMSSVGGGEGSSGMGVEAAAVAVSRVTRHSSTLAPPGSSSPPSHAAPPPLASPPPQRYATSSVLPTPRAFNTSLLDLPIEVHEKIFTFLGFKTVSQMRMVNRQFNTICSTILNSTFQRLQNQMLHRFQAIKAKMPRRESARRSHPLACESDIIETLHMRLSLLQMTFGKHIERKHCCFFPGDILDEVYGILAYLKTATKLARPYKVTDELFDLTTMAMEYFKEHIEPNLPEITYFGTDFFDITTAFSPGESSKSYICMDSPPPSGFDPSASQQNEGRASNERRVSSMSYMMEESLPPSPPPPQSNMVLRKRIHRIKQGMKKYNDQLSALKSDLRSCKRKTALQQKQIGEQQKQIAEQQKQTLEYANRLDDYDKKNEETSRKFQTLLQELNKCKTELQYWRSRSPAVPPLCAECAAALPPAPPHAQWLANAELIEEPASGSGEASPPVAATDVTNDAGAGAGPCRPEGKADKAESSGEEGGVTTPPARRRPSDAAATSTTPDRKKRRLTRPRKL